jgi:sigma-B regulation protein RsbU (phosphoserine phosphatase)
MGQSMNTKPGQTARLVVHDDRTRRVVTMEAFPFSIGQSDGCGLVIAHPQVSREHARIEWDGRGYILRDENSRHGTFVNGVRITRAPLHSGDSILLGSRHNVLVFEDAESDATHTLIAQLSKSWTKSAEESDLEKLGLFLQAAQSLSTIEAVQEVLRTMLEYSIRLTGAERGFVFLGESSDKFRLECVRDDFGGEIVGEPSISRSVIRDAALSREDFIVSDVSEEMAEERGSILANAIRSVVAIPLRAQGSAGLLGLLYLDSQSRTQDFSRISKDILHAIARQAATLLENLRLIEMERESALLRKELQIAAAIQSQIIPQKLPEFEYARLSACTIPCTGVGGDFYDVIPLEDGFVAIVADVSGKGVPAALLASMVQGMFHAQTSLGTGRGIPLVETIASLNKFVCSRTPIEKYLTLAAFRYVASGAEAGTLELVNAGHVEPVIVRVNGEVEVVADGDMPVGLFGFAEYHAIRLVLEVGDRIVLLTDGITEAEDFEGEQFGVGRLGAPMQMADPVASLLGAVEEFCKGSAAQDDRTTLAVERIA